MAVQESFFGIGRIRFMVLLLLSSLVGVSLFAFISSVLIGRWSNPEKSLYWYFLNAALTPLRML